MDTLGYTSLVQDITIAPNPVSFTVKRFTMVPLSSGSGVYTITDQNDVTGDTSKAYLYYDLTTQKLVTMYSNVGETSTLKRVYLAS